MAYLHVPSKSHKQQKFCEFKQLRGQCEVIAKENFMEKRCLNLGEDTVSARAISGSYDRASNWRGWRAGRLVPVSRRGTSAIVLTNSL